MPYYIAFNRYNNDLQAFQLAGNRYQAMELLAGKIWIPDLELGCSLWQGEYRGASRQWLRWYDAQGNWILTEAERTQQLSNELNRSANNENWQSDELKSYSGAYESLDSNLEVSTTGMPK